MNLTEHLAAHQNVGVLRSHPPAFRCSCGATITGNRDQHLADTWQAAHTIRSDTDLDALPDGSVVLWQWGHGLSLAVTRDRGTQYGWDHGSGQQFDHALAHRATARILYRPDEDQP